MTTVLWLYLYVYIVNNVKYDNLSHMFQSSDPIWLIDRKSKPRIDLIFQTDS